MNCEQAMESLELATWGALAMQTRADTADHLRRCGPCRQEVEEVCQLEQLLAGAGDPRPASSLLSSLVAQARPLLARRREALSQAAGNRSGLIARLVARWPWVGFAPRLGVAALLVVLAVMIAPHQHQLPQQTVLRRHGHPMPWRPVSRDYGPGIRTIANKLPTDPTNLENFHQRWYLLDNWYKADTAHQEIRPQFSSDLVHARITFYQDERQAFHELDALYVEAVRTMMGGS